MPVTARHFALMIGLGLFCAVPAFAQPAIAHLSQVEGTVTRLHRFMPATVTLGVVLVEGDQIVTAVGRAELTFVDGSVMHLDHHTQVAIAGPARIRLIDGRVSLRTTTAYTAETSSGVVHVLPQGAFELTASAANRDVLVRVTEGEAQIQSPWGAESVSATQSAFISGPTGRPYITPWVHTHYDAFLQWGNSRVVVLSSGRAGWPPPTFLPYAHPTHRQLAYERLSRKGRHLRLRGGAMIGGNHQIRVNRRGDRQSPRGDSGRAERDARPRDRAGLSAVAPAKVEATSGREGGPGPKPKPVRAAVAGKVVRQP